MKFKILNFSANFKTLLYKSPNQIDFFLDFFFLGFNKKKYFFKCNVGHISLNLWNEESLFKLSIHLRQNLACYSHKVLVSFVVVNNQ